MKLAFLLTLNLVLALTHSPGAMAQSSRAPTPSQRLHVVNVELRSGEVTTFENTVNVGHVAHIRTSNAQLSQRLNRLDLDTFEDNPSAEAGSRQQLEVTKNQIRFRLMLAGVSNEQLRFSGPDRVAVVASQIANVREALEISLHRQLAEQYFMSPEDLQVSLDERFSEIEKSEFDYSTARIVPTLLAELPLGRQQLSVSVQNGIGESVTRRVPVSIAVIRDLVVAKRNLSRGQVLSAENIESVRRPVVNRNVRFASFEQVVGQQIQSDLQQYELIKSGAVGNSRTRAGFTIKKNARVNVVVRRGPLTVVIKDAKALDNGNPGDQIRFQNPRSRESILAKVIDASTAEVGF